MKNLRWAVCGLLAAWVIGLGAARAEVTVLGWPGGPEEAALRATAEAYNKTVADADKVKLIFFNRDSFWDKLETDLAAGTTEFDVNLTATYAVGRYAPFMDPIELSAAAHESFSDGVLKTMQYEGKQYGVPTDLSLHFMYYRSDLMQKLISNPDWQAKYAAIAKAKLGKPLTPKNPDQWTWDDYAATALFFTRSINPDSPTRYGTVLQMKNLLFNMMVWQCVPRSHGANWTDGAGHVTVDSPAYRTGLQYYKMLYDAGTSPKDSLSYEFAEANAAFGSGQVATMLQWNAAFADLNDQGKNPVVAGKIGTIVPPAGPDGRYTHIHALGLGLNKNSKHRASALKFLDWLASPAAMTIYAKAGGSPALQPALVQTLTGDRPDLAKLGTYAGQYGFVMNGATSAKALQIYELQAKEFTGYWAGTQSLDTALQHVSVGMTDLLRK
jgi:multiple sugar transport system substrate-binding protein